MKLRDVIPLEIVHDDDYKEDKFYEYLDFEVSETIEGKDSRFPFKHKFVYVWWILENGIAVGWNENPAIGWSFPVAKIKE